MSNSTFLSFVNVDDQYNYSCDSSLLNTWLDFGGATHNVG